MGVFGKIKPPVAKCIQPPSVNDLFLYALFARIANTDNSTIEFQTKYNPACNQIELIVPDNAAPVFDLITGIQQGPNFQSFIKWLVGKAGGGGTGGLIASDLVITGNTTSVSEQTLATVTVPASTLSIGGGVRIKAWGTFNTNNQTKTIKLYFGSTVVATNDITTKPNDLTWKLEADVYLRSSGSEESIGSGLVGAVSQSAIIASPTEDDSHDIIIDLTGQTLTPTANNIVCHGLTVEAV